MNVIDVPCHSCYAPASVACTSLRPPHLRGKACPERIALYEMRKPKGYHVAKIARGTLGEVSKIEEEFAEFKDALAQRCTVMALVELSDMLGAVEAWLNKFHPTVEMGDLMTMSAITKRAFESGHRKPR